MINASEYYFIAPISFLIDWYRKKWERNFFFIYVFLRKKFLKESQSTQMKEWCMYCISNTQEDLNINRCTAGKGYKGNFIRPLRLILCTLHMYYVFIQSYIPTNTQWAKILEKMQFSETTSCFLKKLESTFSFYFFHINRL